MVLGTIGQPAATTGGVLQLDDSQRRFCAIEHGAVRLLAPAGSGKTQALLWRCKALAERSDKVKPRFLVFTFTRAARDELADRVKEDRAFDDIAALVTIATLNSWGYRMVRSLTKSSRLVVSSQDKYWCIQNVLQPVWTRHPAVGQALEDSRRKSQASQDIFALIDFMKSMGFRHDALSTYSQFVDHLLYLRTCGMSSHLLNYAKQLTDLEVIRNGDNQFEQVFERFVPFWVEACQHLYDAAVLSYEDQKYWARVALESQLGEERYTTGPARYHHILVDEFQDINPLDVQLLKAIAGVNKGELTIVGDDDQAIFEWRGATPAFILDPTHHLGTEYETTILTTNYRSPRNIVKLSQQLISHNRRRVQKKVDAAQTTDAVVGVLRYPSVAEAIWSTVDLVTQLLSVRGCEKVALISRKRSQIIPYQIVFAGRGMPFYAAEDLQVFLSEAFGELKGILAIRAQANTSGAFGASPVDNLLKLCDKIKRFPLSKTDRQALTRHLYAAHPKTLAQANIALSEYVGPLKYANAGGRMSQEFAAVIAHLLDSTTVADSLRSISENFEGLQKDYGKSLEDIFYSDPPFLFLAELAERYGDDYAAFYQDIESAIATLARVPPDDDNDQTIAPEWKQRLHLMTALRAKGKEFDAVIILDANDGIWPIKLATTDEQLEQERRLFYVAMTRARKYLYFVVNDSMVGEPIRPTPYLSEMGLALPDTRA